MQSKIKRVLFLLISFLILVDVLQLVWLYNNYTEQQKQYERLLTSSLGDAAASYQRYYMATAKEWPDKFYLVSSDHQLSSDRQEKKGKQQLIFSGENFSVDSVESALGYSQMIQIKNRNHFDRNLFDSFFKVSLQRNQVSASYILDTFSTKRFKPQKPPPISKLVASKNVHRTEHPGYTQKTSSMLVNTYGNLFVYASFKPVTLFFIKKMALITGSSLLVFLLINLALLYIFKTIREQKKIGEIKNDFINNMTHELRTPVTVASSAIDAIVNHHGLGDERKVRSYLQTARDELLYLDQLIEKILTLSVENQNKLSLQYEEMDIREVLQVIAENHRLTASKELRLTISGTGNPLIKADKLHFANALNNLVDNAIKYSPLTADIHIAYSQTDGMMKIAIGDKGSGIPSEYLSEIFHPFFRVPHGDIHTVKGFGLGLSYAKLVAEQHNGFITAESKVNEGSTFILFLPIHETHV